MTSPPAALGWLSPPWAGAAVGATMTTRGGGHSGGPYASMNVGIAVGDAADLVAANRRGLAQAIGAAPVFLRQVHGTRVVRVGLADATVDAATGAADLLEADASFTTEPGVACVVQVADCLPVLFAAPGGGAVAAAHAGWRGLAGGVLEATVAATCDAAGCAPGALDAWLGACIGADAFEVGADVLVAFGVDPAEALEPEPASPGRSADGSASPTAQHFRPTRPGRWLADLRGLARDRLAACGVRGVAASSDCVVADRSRFFSYRRDRICGRMAAAVWIAGR